MIVTARSMSPLSRFRVVRSILSSQLKIMYQYSRVTWENAFVPLLDLKALEILLPPNRQSDQRDMDYILVSANSTSDAQILDELSVQHALKSSLLTVCGQTASAHIDILAFLDDEGVPQSTGKSAQVILRVNPA